jgi:hypothetical protein
MKSQRFALKVRTAMAEAGSLSGQTRIFLLRNCLKLVNSLFLSSKMTNSIAWRESLGSRQINTPDAESVEQSTIHLLLAYSERFMVCLIPSVSRQAAKR